MTLFPDRHFWHSCYDKAGFADAFTHVSERHARVEDFTTSLCGGLIAQSCNIGFEPLVTESYGRNWVMAG